MLDAQYLLGATTTAEVAIQVANLYLRNMA